MTSQKKNNVLHSEKFNYYVKKPSILCLLCLSSSNSMFRMCSLEHYSSFIASILFSKISINLLLPLRWSVHDTCPYIPSPPIRLFPYFQLYSQLAITWTFFNFHGRFKLFGRQHGQVVSALDSQSGSLTLVACWICSRSSRFQILSHSCK